MKNSLFIIAILLIGFTSTASGQFLITKKDGTKVNVDGQLSMTSNQGVPTFSGVSFGDIAYITRSRANVTLKYMDYATYYQGIKSASTDGSANYYFCLSDVLPRTENDGTLVPDGPGMIMMFDLYANPSEDADNAILPDGNYIIADSAKAGFCNTQFTFARVRDDNDSISYVLINGGYVNVSRQDSIYTISAQVTARDGEQFSLSYQGNIKFDNRSSSAEDSWMKDSIVDTQYNGLTITDYGGDDDYFRYTLQLFDGTSTADGVIDNGTVLNVDLFGVRPTGDSLVIADGTYTASPDYVQIESFEAGTFLSGDVFTALGYPIYIGTYVQDLRNAKEEGLIRYGYCNGGTITLQRDGNQYDISVDLKTRNGLTVSGHYKGEPIYIDKRPQQHADEWNSTLKADKNMEFSDDTYAYAHRYSTYNGTDSLSEFEIVVNDHVTNESFQLDLVVPSTVYSPEGEYTVAPSEGNASYTFVPGYYTFSVMNGTWAWELYESDGYYPIGQAPGMTGNINIRKNTDGTYTILYDMMDDAQPANHIRCAWTGVLNDPRGTWADR